MAAIIETLSEEVAGAAMAPVAERRATKAAVNFIVMVEGCGCLEMWFWCVVEVWVMDDAEKKLLEDKSVDE